MYKILITLPTKTNWFYCAANSKLKVYAEMNKHTKKIKENKMKIYQYIIVIGAILIAGSVLGGFLLHWLITNWLLQFGIVKQISLWLCIVTSVYVGSLFLLSK